MLTTSKFVSVPIFIIILLSNSFTQEKLFIPRNILTAYEKGTRSFDGKPGAMYWQNYADYKIEVDVDPSTYQINGTEEITYYNNSPDSLKRLVIRLYPNIFKKGSARDYAISPESVNDGVSVSKITVDDQSINLENRSNYRVINTIAIIILPKPLAPNSNIDVYIDWTFNISDKVNLRVGVYDSTTVFVGYWYPQIAVYDDVDGWDYNNYSGQTEFYNDFSNFEVSISIPNTFGIWATGELQNPEAVLGEKIYEKYLDAIESDTVVRIITSEDLNLSENFNNDDEKNIWSYKANNVTDFAFAYSDHYSWDGLQTIVDSTTKIKVFLQAVYPSDSPDFKEVAEISKDLANYFSNQIPGITFPFNTFTVFNNGRSGGGMEFPMMVNDGSPKEIEGTVALTAHEMAHQYFPFYVGTNEKKYAFMDEGWAVMLPFKYIEKFAEVNSRLISNVKSYESLAGTEEDIPPMITSLSLSYISYGNSAYNRSSIAYEILRDVLGDKLFLKSLQTYIYRWNGKHPTPYDFFFTFNDVSDEDLSWFWKPWFFENGFPDLAIEKVEANENKAKIIISKVGSIPTPVVLNLIYENETKEEIFYSAEVWRENNQTFTIETNLNGILKEIQLGSLRIPDSNRENNIFLVH